MKTILCTTLLFCVIIGELKSQQVVKIGKQIWTSENLSISTFRNGDVIPEAKTADEWKKAYIEKKAVWCYYNNDEKNGKLYGKLYNFYAVQDSRGIAPNGFHIPTEKEWNQLISTVGGIENAGKSLKATEGWCNSGNGNNDSHFSGKPGGFRDDSGEYVNIECGGYWWTSGNIVNFLNWSTSSIGKNNGKMGGFSVRCVKN